MATFGYAASDEGSANDASGPQRHAGSGQSSEGRDGPRPERGGFEKWARQLGMIGAGVSFVLYIMSVINASTAERVTGVTRSIDELDKRSGVRFEEMDKRIANQFSAMDQRFTERLAAMDQRFTERLAAMDQSFTERSAAMDQKFTGQLVAMDKRLERIEGRADRTDERLAKIETSLISVDAKLDRVLQHIAPRR